MSTILDKTLTVVLAMAAAAVGVSAVRTSFGSAVAPAETKPVFIQAWKNAYSFGHTIGDSAASVKVIALMDFECPGCAILHRALKETMTKHPGRIQVTYVHYPLSYHRFAMPAARAGECAASTGNFHAWADEVFARQDSLGLKGWAQFAAAARIRDTKRIAACAADTSRVARIAAGMAFGEAIKVEATPTVLVNGWKLRQSPSARMLDSMVAAVTPPKP